MITTITKYVAISALLLVPSSIAQAEAAIEISSPDQYYKLINADKPVVAMIILKWCPPCKTTEPLFKNLASSMNNDVTFCIINFETPGLRSMLRLTRGFLGIPGFEIIEPTLKVNAVPAFKYIHKGKVLDTKLGARSQFELEKMIKDFSAKCPKSK
jgi:thiol-disulfide isomerase/thioredoxin